MQPTLVDNTLIGIVLTLIGIGVVVTIIAMGVGARKRAARRWGGAGGADILSAIIVHLSIPARDAGADSRD